VAIDIIGVVRAHSRLAAVMYATRRHEVKRPQKARASPPVLLEW